MKSKASLKAWDRQGRFYQTFLIGFLTAMASFAFFAFPEETIKIKILAINPSSTQNLKTVVAQYLPPEVTPEDVLDKEGLAIKYDNEKKSYLIQKEVDLKPQEARIIEVRIRNVWVITPEEIDEVRSQLKQSADALGKTKFAATGKLLYEKANDSIAQIEENQSKSLGIMQRVDLYRIHIKQIEDLKQNALSLKAMRKLEDEKKSGIREVNFVVTAENPSSEERKLTVRKDLPRDIQAPDILEKGEFALIFDDKKGHFLIEREDTLGPNETKKYEISIRDIWYIPQREIDFLKSELEKLVPLFIKSPFEEFALKQKEFVIKSLTAIEALQAEVSSSVVIDDRIRAHVLNEQREKSAKRKIKELQDLLSEVSLRPTNEKQQGQFEQAMRKIIDFKNKVLVALGKQPKQTIFWWFFLGIVLFLAVVTIIFYSTWLKKLQDNKWVQPGKSDAKSESKPELKA